MRSSSVQKYGGNVQYRNQLFQQPFEDNRQNFQPRPSNQEMMDSHSITASAGKEILRSNIAPNVMDNQQGPYPGSPQQDYAAMTAQSSLSKSPSYWGDSRSQGRLINPMEEEEKMEKKMRLIKYKEALDLMVQDERKRKADDRKEYKEQANIDYRQMDALIQMEKMKEFEEKKMYTLELERLRRQQEEMKKMKKEEIRQENVHYTQEMQKLREIEEQRVLEEKLGKKLYLDANRTIVDLKRQQAAEQKQQEMEAAMRGDHFLSKQDEERQRHYANIRNKAEYFNQRATYCHADPYEKRRQIDDLVNKGIQEMESREDYEARRREEAFNRLKMQTLETNQMQTQERRMRDQRQRVEKEEIQKRMEENQGYIEGIESMRKVQEMDQKKEYLGFLKTQVQAKQETHHRAQSMGRNQEELTSLIKGRSHERNLQLRYLDKWLQTAPMAGQPK